jgi:hypothetical protein
MGLQASVRKVHIGAFRVLKLQVRFRPVVDTKKMATDDGVHEEGDDVRREMAVVAKLDVCIVGNVHRRYSCCVHAFLPFVREGGQLLCTVLVWCLGHFE